MTLPRSDTDFDDVLRGSNAEVIATLVENHRRFLDFVERRVLDRGLAEELLQDAFARGIERSSSVRSNESTVAWFFRLLRNAIVDHRRRAASPLRTTTEIESELALDAGSESEVCRCILGLADTLEPQYAAALKRVDIEGLSVQQFAVEAGITANNASVRLFRARGALKKRVEATCRTCAEHGCFDCTCGSPRPPN